MLLSDSRLWYRQPAKSWEKEALPLGNGRLGVMAFGGVEEDRFALNESTIWAGGQGKGKPGDLSKDIKKVRGLMFTGKDFEAQEYLQKNVMAGEDLGRYQPLGDLKLSFKNSGAISDYRRELDLDSALHEVSFKTDGIKQRRRTFVSAADDVIVIQIEADKPGSLSFEMGLKREENARQSAWGRDGLLLLGQAGSKEQPRGTKFEARLLAVPLGGKLEQVEGGLRVSAADSVLIMIAVATDYNLKDPTSPRRSDFAAGLEAKLRGMAGRSFEELRLAHINAFQALFRRISLDLGKSKGANLPTDERLEAYKAGAKDGALEALYFQYGRYLLISSSRGGPLPANLQGLWNEYLSPPWGSDYHININLQMNYWPAESGGLAECQMPFFDFLENMRPSARQLAAQLGCKGLAAGHTTDAWGTAALSGRTMWGMWVTGLAWTSLHFMEHYRYSGDMVFLKDRAWPYLKENAEFLLDWLTVDPKTGKLVSGPAISPENEFVDAQGRKQDVSMGPSMDQEIAWETFSNVLEAAEILGIKDDFVGKVGQARENLARPGIGTDGRLMEWAQERVEADAGHRHISHLFGIYPGHQLDTPELMAAAKKSLEYRLSHGGGHTGWSRAWIINYWARFCDAEKAYENFRLLLTNSTLPNLFDTHPPFQIDGNFGSSAAVMEMLLQSQGKELELLPALPRAWSEGSVKGIRARGGLSVDITWKKGALMSAQIHSAKAAPFMIRYRGKSYPIQLAAGAAYDFHPLRTKP